MLVLRCILNCNVQSCFETIVYKYLKLRVLKHFYAFRFCGSRSTCSFTFLAYRLGGIVVQVCRKGGECLACNTIPETRVSQWGVAACVDGPVLGNQIKLIRPNECLTFCDTQIFAVPGIELLYSSAKFPGRPSMDILIRSWQDLAKILEKS